MDFDFDAFISYSHSDSNWVNDVLLTALDASGLKVCIDHRNFDEGRSAPDNFVRAIATSQRTVVVLTPEWVKSHYATAEGQMVWSIDPAGWHGRMVPIMRTSCKPPMWISVRSWMDFTDDGPVPAKMDRLIRRLKSKLTDVVRTDDLSDRLGRMSSGPLRKLALRYVVGLEEVAERTRRIGALKEVHDQLDNLQRHCLDPIARMVNSEATVLDDTRLEELESYAITLGGIIEDLHRLERKHVFASVGLGFVAKLEAALEKLTSCHNTQCLDDARAAKELLSTVLRNYPGRIDSRLSEAADQAQLSRVINVIAGMLDEAKRAEPELAADLMKALHDLEQLDDNVQELVHTHTLWQDVDLELRCIETAIAPNNLTQLTNQWPEIKERVTFLSAAVPTIVRTSDSLGPSVDTALAGKDARLTISRFRMYKSHAGTRFTALDTNLKDQCEELVKAGDSVARLVERLRYE